MRHDMKKRIRVTAAVVNNLIIAKYFTKAYNNV